MKNTAGERSEALSRLKTEPQTSARALCISGRALGRIFRNAVQVCSNRVESVEDMRRYLKRADNVDKRTVSVSAEIDRAAS